MPYPERIESLEDVKQYLKDLRNRLQEDQSERIDDFDWLKMDNKPVIDVREYGAKGDDSTNDTVAIQAALTSMSSGGTLYCPDAYQCGYITIPHSNITILGMGRGKSKFTLLDDTDTSMIFASGKDKVRICGIEINGNTANQTTDGNLLEFETCTNVTVEYCDIHDSSKDGVYVYDCDDVWIQFNIIRDNDRDGVTSGLTTDESNRIYVLYNTIYNHNKLTSGYGGTDTHNGIAIDMAIAHDSIVAGNIIYNSAFGIIVECSHDTLPNKTSDAVTISDNTVIAPGTAAGTYRGVYGIELRGREGNTTNCSVKDNKILGDWYKGIYVLSDDAGTFNSDRHVIGDNILNTKGTSTAGSIGILVEYGSESTKIKGNHVEGYDYEGIILAGHASHPCEYPNVSGNTVRNCGQTAAQTKDAIRISECYYGVFNSNIISGTNHRYGISAYSNSNFCEYNGNSISEIDSGGTQHPINIDAGAGTCHVINGVVQKVSVAVSTSATGEDDLRSWIIPQNFHKSHEGLRIKASGNKSGANGNKTIKFHIGSSSVTMNGPVNDEEEWTMEATIFLNAANAQRYDYTFFSGVTPSIKYDYIATSQDLSAGAVTIKLTGECAHADDAVTQILWLVEVF